MESIVYIVRASKRVKSSVMGVGLLLHEKVPSLSLFLFPPLLPIRGLIAFKSVFTYRLQIYFLD